MYLFITGEPSLPVKATSTPPQLKDPEVQNLLQLDHNFDMRTVTERTGYPSIAYKAQTWRAQRDIAFPGDESDPDSDPIRVATPKRLCRGGKIYLASTG
ncbi:uncharacterized protein CLUP02_13985 [Colletotrichum lupini]|uniref:Uncharacterized protein n=2 Tax=Colletotrichum acutatum species complex TaxID=2707335 RepID=A0A9Q8WMA0_9PEZI|nr:uncharacterized protein CLUP02_13985 [Colletotrichum lupini]KAI3528607.1 hypothetical protein CSPX01_16115 [Colletotrichum filicis]KAK1455470.1 hypothetical protein CMEL01_04230 [Colletotrichum melonis]UQC88461.1 hypothetical protein CLUP02_13985 [Colletotrichum lupini]